MTKVDRLDPERVGKRLNRLRGLTLDMAVLWMEALEVGTSSPRRESNGRGTGFHDSDPTHTIVDSATQRQIRAACRRASALVDEAVANMEEARSVITDGFLRTDSEVLSEFLAKRRAAIG